MAKLIEYRLEYTMNSSEKILFNRLSSPSGLSEWFADDVNVNEDIYTFIWDGSEQQAKLINKKANKFIRYQWLDLPDYTFFEFSIEIDDLTSDVALVIIDFAEENEKDEAIMLWDSQIETLKKILGL